MSRSILYLGLDVHKESVTVAVLRLMLQLPRASRSCPMILANSSGSWIASRRRRTCEPATKRVVPDMFCTGQCASGSTSVM